MVVNSKEYWNKRFDTDWNMNGGEKQSVYFANVLCKLLPQWIKNEIVKERYSVCDMGCATGDGTNAFSIELGIRVDGADFSKNAVECAASKYVDSSFFECDVTSISDNINYDVVLCSNVLEHFKNPWDILTQFTSCAKKYIVIMVPYREQINIDEHAYKFSEDNIPIQCSGFELSYNRIYDCSLDDNTPYPDRQIILIYERIGAKDRFLSAYTEGYSEFSEKNKQLVREIETLSGEIESLSGEIRNKDYIIERARNYCYLINSSKTYKWCCLLYRFIQQFVKGDHDSRKAFKSILRGKIKKDNSTSVTKNDSYNILLNVTNILDANDMYSDVQRREYVSPNNLGVETRELLRQKYDKMDIIILSVISYDFRFQRPQQFAKRFAENGHRVYYINSDFQKKEGIDDKDDKLKVVNYYCEDCSAIYYTEKKADFANWITNKIDDLIYKEAICDAVIIVDYPNWYQCAEELRKKYGFKIITDYMDDYMGFSSTASAQLKDNCGLLLENSDLVIASSAYLQEEASKYNKNSVIIRNGAETSHFGETINTGKNVRPVIGYYGAISDWFDWEKVCYVAKRRPEWDVVLIGGVTNYKKELERYSNIKLLGEMAYDQLPKALAGFDVCIIPFDTSTNLIKATNPVKFYEYLSAGKKIVATDIPELREYKDAYAYLTNDNEEFLDYLDKCVYDKDSLLDAGMAKKKAEENDWQCRYNKFCESVHSVYPKISIIIVTYNNLELNQGCINSVLENTAYPNYELIIVDNASSDGTIGYLKELEKRKDPRIKVILNDDNLGFAGGNNKAIGISDGEYIVLLNNDTIVTRGWLSKWLKYFVNEKGIGMIGAVTNSIGNEAKIRVNYKDIYELQSFAYQYTMSHLNQKYCEVDRLAMFATIIDKKTIEKCGVLDENYQVGMFEDDDYAMAVKEADLSFFIAEDVFIHHVNNASFKKLDSSFYKELFAKNKAKYEKKWGVKWKEPRYRRGVFTETNKESKA